MTAQKSWRQRAASWLATITAVLLAASGLALAPTAALANEGPQITLSKPVLKPNGDDITVTGTGFDVSAIGLASYYDCESGAIAPKGFYVQLGWINDDWRPSKGGANNVDRKGGPNTWFADGDLNCQAPSTWTIESDGTASFEHTFRDVEQEMLGEPTAGARYAVFTSGAGGGTQTANEVSADIAFYPASVDAQVSSATLEGLEVSTSAAGIPAGVTGTYAALIERGTEDQLVGHSSTAYAAFALPFPTVTDGAASFTMTAPANKLDRNKKYEVLLWKQHDNATPENIYGRADVEITDAQWDAVFPSTTASVKFSKSSAKYNVGNAATVTVASAGGTPTGKVTLKVAGQSYTAKLSGGKATIKLKKAVKVGTHTATVTYTNSGSGTLYKSSKATTKVKVTKATPTVKTKLVKSTVKTSQNPKIKVTATIPGSLKAKAAKYKVAVYDGKKKIKTQKLNSSGKATVKLKKLNKGTHKIKVKVLASNNAKSKTSATKKLKVVK